MENRTFYDIIRELKEKDSTSNTFDECFYFNGKYMYGPRGVQGPTPIPSQEGTILKSSRAITVMMALKTEQLWEKYYPQVLEFQNEHLDIEVDVRTPLLRTFKYVKEEHEEEAFRIGGSNNKFKEQIYGKIHELELQGVKFEDEDGDSTVHIPEHFYAIGSFYDYNSAYVIIRCHCKTGVYQEMCKLFSVKP